ncbi:hypothetical protein NC651_006145 [Populus alba x Populus x berolinensis]|nr:hypothetical protein NC651_006145 [Populus alba x Populus x berolinensis]
MRVITHTHTCHGSVSSSHPESFGMLFTSKNPKLQFQRSETNQN